MKKIIQIKIVFLLFIATLLSGCEHIQTARQEYIKDHEKDYLSSRIFAPLQVPPDLSQIQANETFPLPPDLPDPATLGHVSLKPPGFDEIS